MKQLSNLLLLIVLLSGCYDSGSILPPDDEDITTELTAEQAAEQSIYLFADKLADLHQDLHEKTINGDFKSPEGTYDGDKALSFSRERTDIAFRESLSIISPAIDKAGGLSNEQLLLDLESGFRKAAGNIRSNSAVCKCLIGEKCICGNNCQCERLLK